MPINFECRLLEQRSRLTILNIAGSQKLINETLPAVQKHHLSIREHSRVNGLPVCEVCLMEGVLLGISESYIRTEYSSVALSTTHGLIWLGAGHCAHLDKNAKLSTLVLPFHLSRNRALQALKLYLSTNNHSAYTQILLHNNSN